MYITQIEGWYNVGYLEESLEVPLKDLVNNSWNWRFTNARLSCDRLFSSIKLPIGVKGDLCTYEQIVATKYLRIKYDNLTYFYYGWVDNVNILSDGVILINWHPDYWRTFIRSCKIKGWVHRRYLSGNDPYQLVPSTSSHATFENDNLAGQRRGVAWVILTYLPGDGFFSAAAKVGLSAIPGSSALKALAKGAAALVKGIANTFNNYAVNPVSERPSKEIGAAWVTNSWNDFVICCTFPVSVNVSTWLYLRSYTETGMEWLNTYRAPSLLELMNGQVGAILGIEANRLVSCYMSPVCPVDLNLESLNNGETEKNPLIVSKGNDFFIIKYKHENIAIEKIERRGVLGWCGIHNFGLRNIGDIRDGCPYLESILTNYYTGYYPLPKLEYENLENGVNYEVVVKQPYIKAYTAHKCHTYWYMPFKLWLNAAYPNWKELTFFDRTAIGMLREETDPETHFVRYFDFSRLSRFIRIDPKEEDKVGLPKWVCNKTVKDNKVTYEWSYDYSGLVLVDVCVTNKDYREKGDKASSFELGGISYTFNQPGIWDYDNKAKKYDHYYYAHIDSLFIAVAEAKLSPDQDEPVPLIQDNILLPEIKAAYTDVSGLYKLSKMWSITSDWLGRGYIQSMSTTWPILRGSFSRTYKADEFCELYIIGPTGNPVYKFPVGSVVKNYTYQTVVSGASAYVKIKFESESPNAFLSGNEVHVPLTPAIAFTQYSNPWTTTAEMAQTVMRQQAEYDKIKMERDNINLRLQYDREKADNNIMGQIRKKWGGQGNDLYHQVVDRGRNIVGNLQSQVASPQPQVQDVKPESTGFFGSITQGTQNLVKSIAKPITDSISASVAASASTIASVALPLLDVASKIDPITPIEKYRHQEDNLIKEDRRIADAYRDKMQSLDGYIVEPTPTSLLNSNDISWFHEYGSIALACVTKDEYSINKYYNVVEKLGVEVNEYNDKIEESLINGGPCQVVNAEILSTTAPREAITYITARLNGGVYINPKL